jgi:aspartyl-tRNA(Asn)/glutamyl-tRNA(Gln) amidotransferase subunit A
MTDLAGLSARALARAIAEKKLSSLEATKEAIKRLVACHELTNCIVALEADAALDGARATDAAIAERGAAGALAGVPLAHKDMFDRKDKIASWGANIRADRPAERDAAAIAAFGKAGALQIATLHLAEFAYGATGHNYVLGHARNPWDPARITGGSSAGTAAAVAYGAIPLGLGSDTGGRCACPPPAAASPPSSRPGDA